MRVNVIIKGEPITSINSRPVIDGWAIWGRGFFGSKFKQILGVLVQDTEGNTLKLWPTDISMGPEDTLKVSTTGGGINLETPM